MITKPTLLVIGAGGSCPFGFPLGWGLMTNIISHARGETYTRYGFDRATTQRFGDLLESSGCASIDDFLQARPDLADLGKVAIADLIIRLESHASLFSVAGARSGPTWYDHLLARLSTEAKSLRANRLAVVTFNYDRSFEYYLRTALMARFGLSDVAADQEVSRLNVVHVHGSLGSLERRPYESNNYDVESVRESARSIRVAHERGGADDVDVSSFVMGAERIYFVGFGFLPSNMRRLFPVGAPQAKAELYASGYGMTDEERRIANHYAGRAIEFAPPGYDALGAMRFLRDVST